MAIERPDYSEPKVLFGRHIVFVADAFAERQTSNSERQTVSSLP
jgi:hypothetical protein